MSGIAGFIGDRISSESLALLNSMCQEIRYVESDLTDLWSDEHFSIARVHHGIVNPEKQPIFNEDKSLIIFMDGEVYDYDDDRQMLINKGHRFRYDYNDAEFCLHLYEEYSEKSFIRLNGSFLIAIYNLHNQELIIANDRFSSRLLFYFSNAGLCIFGSQLKAVIQSEIVASNLDSQAIFEFFTFQRILGDKTYYKDVKILLPASILKAQSRGISFKRYWKLNYKEDKRKSEEYYVDALSDALKSAVKRRTRSNLKYGILLSGGLDSRAVLAASGRSMSAFTIADFKNSEFKISKEIAAIANCDHIYLRRDLDYYPNILKIAVELGDGMFNFWHAHFIGFADQIRKKSEILLHGYGFDTIFKGCYLPKITFNIFGKSVSLPILRSLSQTTLIESILKLNFSLWGENLASIFSEEFAEIFDKDLQYSVESILYDSRNFASDPYNRFEYFILHFPSRQLAYLNQICIKNFIDERIIAYDNDLFNLYLRMPVDLRFEGKIFKKAVEKLDLPISRISNANTGLSPTIPLPIEWFIVMNYKLLKNFYQQKLSHPTYTQGSWPKMSELIRHNDKLKQLIWDVLCDEESISPAIFNREKLIRNFNMYLNKQQPFSWLFYLLATFGTWYKKYAPK